MPIEPLLYCPMTSCLFKKERERGGERTEPLSLRIKNFKGNLISSHSPLGILIISYLLKATFELYLTLVSRGNHPPCNVAGDIL